MPDNLPAQIIWRWFHPDAGRRAGSVQTGWWKRRNRERGILKEKFNVERWSLTGSRFNGAGNSKKIRSSKIYRGWLLTLHYDSQLK